MASTFFVDQVTPIISTWLNDVNTAVYTTIPAILISNPEIGLQQYQIATAGQTVFTLFTYTIGSNHLHVFVNGSKQIKSLNYTESSTSSVTFGSGLNVGDIVEFVGI